MKEKQNNTIISEDGYNICPKCGGQAYAITMDAGAYYVGCPYCGLQNGVSCLTDEMDTEDFIEQMRIEWNQKCLKSMYEDDVIVMLGVLNNEYVVVNNVDYHVVHIARDIRELVNFVNSSALATSLEAYVMIDSYLQPLSCSFLISKALYDFKK